MAIGIHEVLKGEDEAQTARGEKDGADKVGHFFCGAFSHEIKGKDKGELGNGKDGVCKPEDAEPVVLMVGGGDPDLADGGDLGDKMRLVPAKEELGQGEYQDAAVRAQHGLKLRKRIVFSDVGNNYDRI